MLTFTESQVGLKNESEVVGTTGFSQMVNKNERRFPEAWVFVDHVLSRPLLGLHRLVKLNSLDFQGCCFSECQLGPPRVNETPLRSFVPRNHLLYAVFARSTLDRGAEPDFRYWSLLSRDGKRSPKMRHRLDANWSTGRHTLGVMDAMRFHNSGIGL
jgi:hypothetical protein